jgi:hypothetical protein
MLSRSLASMRGRKMVASESVASLVTRANPAPSAASRAAPSAVSSTCAGRTMSASEQVGLDLHEQVVGRGAAVHAQAGQHAARVLLHGPNQIDVLQGHSLQSRTGDVSRPGAAREAKNRAARFGAPVGRAQSSQGRHDGHSPVVGNGCGQALTFGCLPDDSQPVAQPLNERA